MDFFADSGWVEIPKGATPEESVKALVDSGVVTKSTLEDEKPEWKERKKRVKKVAETKTESGSESVLVQEKQAIYTGAAYDAYKFLERFEEPRYVFYIQNWWKYDSQNGWRQVLDVEMQHDVADFLVESCYKCDANEVAKILLAMVHFCRIPYAEDVFDQTFLLTKTESGVLEVEHSPGWVVCENATFHVPTVAKALFRGESVPDESVAPLSSTLFTQGRIPCKLNFDAKCERWESFIESACPFDRECLQQMFGLSLTFDRSFCVFFIVFGPAGSGKSTCLNILQRLNRGTVSQVSMGRFGERFYIYPLSQNRANIVHDMDSIFEGDGSVSLREAVLKSVAAGESMEVERKHRHAKREYLRALCVFGTNQVPRFADKSEAIAQRMKIIQFPNSFRGTEGQVRNLTDILACDLEGVLIWALKGYGMLLEMDALAVSESQEAYDLKTEAFKDMRPEIQFCDECIVFDDFIGFLPSLEVYKAYANFCTDRGYCPAGMSKVIPLIASYLGVDLKRRRIQGVQVRGLVGVSLAGGTKTYVQ
ncbi:MAG: DUF5906 domain-containing protein [Planctomycetia bacterium]|nr:DUF5906 domain-containing protein [Planctomycetia bacterium]